MTFKYNNVFIVDTSTVTGPYEKKGPLNKFFDKTYDDLYMDEDTFEKAESKLLKESVEILLNKNNEYKGKIDLILSGDLLNQITSSTYALKDFNIPFIGLYSACATNVEGIILASSLIESKSIKNAIVSTSSHNMASEKQFRNPTEYGTLKPKTATFTSTAGASILLSNKGIIKIESSTIGKIVDLKQNNPLHPGSVMAPAAADTIYTHLNDLNRNIDYYDLIITGDLGIYGKEILKEYMKKEYNIELKNYIDAGVVLYDLEKQKYVNAGGSGPVCNCLVNYTKIFNDLKTKKLKKVLIVATGELFSSVSIYQKNNIYSIAHAISLEAI